MIKINHAKSMPSQKEIAAVEARIDAIFNNEYLQFISSITALKSGMDIMTFPNSKVLMFDIL